MGGEDCSLMCKLEDVFVQRRKRLKVQLCSYCKEDFAFASSVQESWGSETVLFLTGKTVNSFEFMRLCLPVIFLPAFEMLSGDENGIA